MQVIISSALEQGLIYCFMVLGVFLTFRVLDFPDLTVDGSLPLGAAVTGALIVGGHSPLLATAAGVGAGLCAGLVTGCLHLLLKSGESDSTNYGPKLLAGILTMTALYTVNLRIMGRSNIPLLGVDTIFEKLGKLLSLTMIGWNVVLAVGALAIVVKYLLDWLLHTEFGLTLLATGDNEQMIRAMGTNTNFTRIVGLSLANGLVALTGSLVAQQQGFADVGMGIGTIVAGLASLIMGEVIFGVRSVSWVLFSVIGGSIVYRLLIAVSLRLGIAPTDLKLLTAALVVVALSIPTVRSKVVRSVSSPATLEVRGLRKVFFPGTANEVVALNGIDLEVPAGQFVSIIGSNGSGKSTLLNAVAGTFPVSGGTIVLGGSDVTKQAEYVRSRMIGRVFQDPRAGTAPSMTIEENLSISLLRSRRSGLRRGVTNRRREVMRTQLSRLGMGLEGRLKAGVNKLSGGQRQAMSLLMATIAEPSLLLLDEHTAALDPKVAATIMGLTATIVTERGLTTLMVTHNMELALRYGNRLIMMHAGRVVLDLDEQQKSTLKVSDLIEKFHEVAGEAFAVDRMLLE